VLTNLLSNAFKYAPGNPVEVRVAIEGRSALLEVADHGPGIPAEQATMVFEKFHRASASKNLGGLGLGLYIVKQIVERHGGSISVSSPPGEGAAFTVRLPMR
jgi:signal transduction histidine kinase